MANTPPKDKRFESGEIVFWCHQRGHEYSVHYGMVDEQYKFDVYIDYLAPRERRRIYSDYIKVFRLTNLTLSRDFTSFLRIGVMIQSYLRLNKIH